MDKIHRFFFEYLSEIFLLNNWHPKVQYLFEQYLLETIITNSLPLGYTQISAQ